jgi:hypothetical protein
MSTLPEAAQSASSWSPESSRPLDETIWRAWLAKNLADEQRGTAGRIRLFMLFMFLLVAAVALHARLGPIGDANGTIAVPAVSDMALGGNAVSA